MTYPTWGITIPGYSSPSPRQKKAFDRMYPGLRQRVEQELRERKDAEERRVKAFYAKQYACPKHHYKLEGYSIFRCVHCEKRFSADSHRIVQEAKEKK